MAQNLIAGQNCPVPQDVLHVVISTDAAADISSFRLYADGKTRQDEDFIFYGQCANEDNTVTYAQKDTVVTFMVDLSKMRADAEKVAFSVTADTTPLCRMKHMTLEILQAGTVIVHCAVQTSGKTEAALILGELYRRQGAWKFRFVEQGFNGGLKPLAEFFGVDIADEAAAPPAASPPPAAPPPDPKVNLSKINLTKESPRIDLKKKDTGDGLVRVNLNWHRGEDTVQKESGFWKKLTSRGGNSGIDLDLGAFFRLKNGDRGIVQALGNTFGSINKAPYIQLMGDDRTGAQADGEWLHINGKYFDEIDEILIYTFIYEGAPRWSATDGVVTIHVPGQPPIETRLTEGNDRLPMCAIASISNHRGDMRVERVNRYFADHRDMDKAFGWGFSWTSGSK